MIKTLALVVKKQNLGEVDRILTVITPDLGKRRLVARGIRKPLSKLAGHLDTLMLTRVMLTEEEDLAKITSADLEKPFEKVRSNLVLAQRAWAVVGLAEKVALEGTSQRALFRLVVDSLNSLDQGADWGHIWVYYLANLSRLLGWGESYRQCSRCASPLVNRGALSDFGGQVVCLACAPKNKPLLQPGVLKLINFARQSSFSIFGRIRWQDDRIPQEAEEVILSQLADHINVPWRQIATLT